MNAMQHAARQDGFSLLELLVASGLFFSLMVGVLTLYAQTHRGWARGQSRIESQQSARVAVESMAREIRLAGYDPSGAIETLDEPAAVQTAEGAALTFLADTNGDAVTDRVTYRLVGARVLREFSSWDGSSFTAPLTSLVAEGVSSLVFGYSDAAAPANNPIAAPVEEDDLASIRRVTVDLVTTQETSGRRESYPLIMDVQLRNL
jgi:type IV pilus assembly protein PilW